MSESSDIEKNDTRRSKSKKGKATKKKKKSEQGAIEDIRLPTQLMEYGVPVDVGKRIVTFSDVDKSAYDAITEIPFCPTPWNFVFASKHSPLIFKK